MDTRAEKDGDEYVLNGTKQFITNASEAGSVLVKAVTDPGAGYDGISTFIVDPDDDGFEVTTIWDKMGLNASPTCEIQLDDVRLSEDRLLGAESIEAVVDILADNLPIVRFVVAAGLLLALVVLALADWVRRTM